VEKCEGKRPLGILNVGGRIILKYVLEKYEELACRGSIWLETGTNGGLL
jgi:hypothetical protein